MEPLESVDATVTCTSCSRPNRLSLVEVPATMVVSCSHCGTALGTVRAIHDSQGQPGEAATGRAKRPGVRHVMELLQPIHQAMMPLQIRAARLRGIEFRRGLSDAVLESESAAIFEEVTRIRAALAEIRAVAPSDGPSLARMSDIEKALRQVEMNASVFLD